jgi:hypothetical protein
MSTAASRRRSLEAHNAPGVTLQLVPCYRSQNIHECIIGLRRVVFPKHQHVSESYALNIHRLTLIFVCAIVMHVIVCLEI